MNIHLMFGSDLAGWGGSVQDRTGTGLV